MRRRLRLAPLRVGMPLGLLLAGPGCGGDDSTAAVLDATASIDSSGPAPDATESTDALSSADMPSSDMLVAHDANDALPPADASGAFCQAEQQFYQRCNRTSPCEQQNLAACGAVQASFSAAAVQGAIACAATNSCDRDGGRQQNVACLEQHLAGATPTAVAMSFCSQCRPDAGAASCDAAFFDIAGEASINIVGFLLLEVNDVTATNIETACTGAFLDDAGSPQGCAARFFVCADRLALQANPGDACRANDAGAGG